MEGETIEVSSDWPFLPEPIGEPTEMPLLGLLRLGGADTVDEPLIPDWRMERYLVYPRQPPVRGHQGDPAGLAEGEGAMRLLIARNRG